MSYKVFQIGLFLSYLALLNGCCSTCKVDGAKIENGHFRTNTTLAASEFLVNEKPDLTRYSKTLYIRNCTNEFYMFPECYCFMKNAITNVQLFESVYEQRDIKQTIAADGTAKSSYDVSEKMISDWLASHYKKYLVLDYEIKRTGGYTYIFALQVSDGNTNEVLLNIQKNAFNVSGLDQILFYPVLNGFSDWVRTNRNSK